MDIPVYIIAFNNPTYVKMMVDQLKKLEVKDIIIVDNNSTYEPLLEYYKVNVGKFKLIKMDQNYGHLVVTKCFYNFLPQVFAITDPDLQFHPNIPKTFLQDLYEIGKKYNSYKVGMALDISEPHLLNPNLKYGNESIINWESRFWHNRIHDDKFELYDACIDTTFAVYNKDLYREYYDGTRCNIRVAGNYIAKHIPWYKDDLMSLDEKNNYSKTIITGCWNNKEDTKIYPISFGIHPSLVVDKINYNKKKSFFSDDIPYYAYNVVYEEKELYINYQNSFYAYTTTKDSWDNMLHYQILANGCVPYFSNLEDCPDNRLFNFPKSLVLQAINLPGVSPGYIDFTIFPIQEYFKILNQLLEYTKNNLTTVSIAKKFLQSLGKENPKILFLSGNTDPDYQRCLLLQGLKEITYTVDHPKIPHIYQDYPIEQTSHLFARGYAYTRNIKSDNYEFSEYDIINKKYDLVVYGSAHRGLPHWELVNAHYSKKDIIVVCGETHHINKCTLDTSYNCFIKDSCDSVKPNPYKDHTIISLGIDCNVAQFTQSRNLREFSLPFDWTICYNGVYDILKNNFKNYTKNITLFNNKHINKYDVLFFHDNIKDQNTINKYNRRIERFSQVLQTKEKILFIKTSHKHWHHDDDKYTDDYKDAMKTINLIKERYPKLNFVILLILCCDKCFNTTFEKNEYLIITKVKESINPEIMVHRIYSILDKFLE
jgi:hypothetical protein